MPTNYTITLYTYDELSEEAKARARDWYREAHPPEPGWWESIYEWAKEAGDLMGVQIDDIWFSGFWSQGDGACFTGDYGYKPYAHRKVMEAYPTEAALHAIALRLQLPQVHHLCGLRAKVTHVSRYCHEYSTEIEVTTDHEEVDAELADEVREQLRAFMRWIYRKLEKEYEYLVSDESVAEQLQADGEEFHEDGSPYCGPARAIAAGSHAVSYAS